MSEPTSWAPEHSVAALLIGMAMIDGEVDADEMRALVGVLRAFPGFPADRSAAIAQEVYRHLWADQEAGGDLLGELRRHAAQVSLAFDAAAIEHLLARLGEMADIDGSRHPLEQRLLAALRSAWA